MPINYIQPNQPEIFLLEMCKRSHWKGIHAWRATGMLFGKAWNVGMGTSSHRVIINWCRRCFGVSWAVSMSRVIMNCTTPMSRSVFSCLDVSGHHELRAANVSVCLDLSRCPGVLWIVNRRCFGVSCSVSMSQFIKNCTPPMSGSVSGCLDVSGYCEL